MVCSSLKKKQEEKNTADRFKASLTLPPLNLYHLFNILSPGAAPLQSPTSSL